MNLEISATDYINEKNGVKLNLRSKLVLANGLVSLPDPTRWFAAPYNLLNTIYEQVNKYLKDTYTGKAFKGVEKLAILRTYK